ncbi:hypothetical protein TWF506_011426 [Arthrobotrys conoides]|uniref:Uncharacterized protein n=1 Tax=Arthrobotrys conoides TaxID=74498 RepID=A0AAN8RS27_9PEZI
MYISSRFNLLIVAIIALVSFCTARTTITSQSCSTRYCANPTKVFRTTKTIHKTIRYTITLWMTSTKYTSTHTLTSTKYTTTTSYVATTTLRTVTIFTGTTTITETLVNSVYATGPSTTTRTRTIISTPTYTVPAPSGFLAVDNDPDNSASPEYTALPPLDRKRDVDVNIKPRDPANKYAAAVTCTKTLITKTGTTNLWKTTTKTTGVTTKLVYKTVKITRTATRTVTANNAPTTRVRSTKYTSIFSTSTMTIWTVPPITISTTTYLTSEATATVYAVCANNNLTPDNLINPPRALSNYGPAADEKVVEIIAPGGPETCCMLCHNYSGPGKCMGSIYNFRGAEIPEEDCPDAFENGVFLGWEFCPFDPDDYMRCQLIVSEDGEATCRTHGFEFIPYVFGKTRIKQISNGPGCARFKYQAPSVPVP